jgi:hypothetical protein
VDMTMSDMQAGGTTPRTCRKADFTGMLTIYSALLTTTIRLEEPFRPSPLSTYPPQRAHGELHMRLLGLFNWMGDKHRHLITSRL